MRLISAFDGGKRNVNLWPEKLFLLNFVKVLSYQAFETSVHVVVLPRPPVDVEVVNIPISKTRMFS